MSLSLLLSSSSSSSSSSTEAAQKGGVEKVEEAADGENMGAGNGVVGKSRMSDSTERAGQTRLHIAASKGDLSAVQEIMMGPDKVLLMAKDKAGHTCLDCAAENGHLDVCFQLCKSGGAGLIFSQGKVGFPDEIPCLFGSIRALAPLKCTKCQ